MNNEQILTELYKIKSFMDEKKIYFESVELLIEGITENINLQIAKKQNKKRSTAAAIRLLKWSDSNRPEYSRAFKTSRGEQMLVNGAWGIILHDNLPIPAHDEQELKKLNGTREMFEKIIENGRENRGFSIPAPTRAELKTLITVSKAKNRAERPRNRTINYKLTEGYFLDAEYLLAVIEIIPDAVFVTRDPGVSSSWNLQPVYFSGTAGEGVLLPLRPQSKKGENQ